MHLKSLCGYESASEVNDRRLGLIPPQGKRITFILFRIFYCFFFWESRELSLRMCQLWGEVLIFIGQTDLGICSSITLKIFKTFFVLVFFEFFSHLEISAINLCSFPISISQLVQNYQQKKVVFGFPNVKWTTKNYFVFSLSGFDVPRWRAKSGNSLPNPRKVR